jgi:SAM-dependent methyltransferase
MPVFFNRGGNKGAHGRFLNDYSKLVDQLLAREPRDTAMLTAIGGKEHFGDLEFALLSRFGFGENSYLIDVGCGSGRLARRAARAPGLRFFGTDINAKLLAYAAESCKRPDFRFQLVDSTQIPEHDDVADMVTFFSVGTHMLHEEFFIYLEEARRVLKPGGRIVFSFLDIQVPDMRSVFTDTYGTVRAGRELPHLNVFIGRCDIPVWAEMLAMRLVDLIPGDEPFVEADEWGGKIIGRRVAGETFGQSVAVLEKP